MKKSSKSRRSESAQLDEATQQWQLGLGALFENPLFQPLLTYARAFRAQNYGPEIPKDGWIVVTAEGRVFCHPTRRATATEWNYVIAHGLLHLGFGHFTRGRASSRASGPPPAVASYHDSSAT